MFKVKKDVTSLPLLFPIYSRRSSLFIVNFRNISHLFVVLLLLTLNKYLFAELPVVSEKLHSSYGNHI